MAYAAENVPHFVDLMKYTGKTVDRDGVWQLMFDNTDSIHTPFWGGFWFSTFSDFLGIRY
jgi:hypothetical protein